MNQLTELTCRQCKRVFSSFISENRKFCSLNCYWQHRRENYYQTGPKESKTGRHKKDKVGYGGLHYRIAKALGKPSKCEHCGLEDPEHPRRFHWANKSHQYLDDLSDWMRLCASCHVVYDNRKPMCKRGHPRSPENIYIMPATIGVANKIQCLVCNRESSRRSYYKRKGVTNVTA